MVLLFVVLIFSGCNLNFLNDNDEENAEPAPANYSVYDESDDTLYYYSGEDDSVISYSEYNYNESGQCVQIKVFYNSEPAVLTGATTYGWDGDNLTSRASWNQDKDLTALTLLEYNVSNEVVGETVYNYNGTAYTLDTYQTWEYSVNGDLIRTDIYEADEWSSAYTYEYQDAVLSSGILLTKAALYTGTANERSAYFQSEYDGKTG